MINPRAKTVGHTDGRIAERILRDLGRDLGSGGVSGPARAVNAATNATPTDAPCNFLGFMTYPYDRFQLKRRRSRRTAQHDRANDKATPQCTCTPQSTSSCSWPASGRHGIGRSGHARLPRRPDLPQPVPRHPRLGNTARRPHPRHRERDDPGPRRRAPLDPRPLRGEPVRGHRPRPDPQVRPRGQSGRQLRRGLFAFPHGFALDHNGFLWVTEGGAHGDPRGVLGESMGMGHQVFKLTRRARW